jgi:hypothetical protein
LNVQQLGIIATMKTTAEIAVSSPDRSAAKKVASMQTNIEPVNQSYPDLACF